VNYNNASERARLAVFDARLKYGNEENSFVDAAKEKEKQNFKRSCLAIK